MEKIKIGIVGLGLMGGSFSIALKETSNSYYFIGLDHNQKHSKEAIKLNLVDEIVTSIEEISKCDIIILNCLL